MIFVRKISGGLTLGQSHQRPLHMLEQCHTVYRVSDGLLGAVDIVPNNCSFNMGGRAPNGQNTHQPVLGAWLGENFMTTNNTIAHGIAWST